MIQCLICDDEASVTNNLYALIEDYNRHYQTNICCQVFNNPILAAETVPQEKYDLYLLDIVMPNMTGIQLAETIRANDNSGIIVFLTSSPEYHAEAFSLEALQYLQKPVNQSAFFRVLGRSLTYISRQRSAAYVTIQTRTGIYTLTPELIIYVESNRHILTFFIDNALPVKTLSGSLSLEKLMGILNDSSFYAPYKGYIINFEHVNSMDKHGFTMSNQTTVPISERQYSKIRKDYSDYLLKTSERAENN
ncbi:LytR/AlgR family response regulator transcription factor [Acetobacterium bakii]|uniref:Stage 0 sporulation protein A homolog n=1 Tax=Acetobacterium bakii TaxID=52689 RepID=A0A0L6U091_9FIRM|nr:LytTR family DNA-binding domain-containing protein [Acetobacterium bakii]KNZ41250.1 hypothetical protein AKG39_13105 [Acetobacterium bakii]